MEKQREKREKESRRSGKLPVPSDSVCWGIPLRTLNKGIWGSHTETFFSGTEWWGVCVRRSLHLKLVSLNLTARTDGMLSSAPTNEFTGFMVIQNYQLEFGHLSDLQPSVLNIQMLLFMFMLSLSVLFFSQNQRQFETQTSWKVWFVTKNPDSIFLYHWNGKDTDFFFLILISCSLNSHPQWSLFF